MEEFYHVMKNASIGDFGDDYWLWLKDSSTMLSVKSDYSVLYNSSFGSHEIDIQMLVKN